MPKTKRDQNAELFLKYLAWLTAGEVVRSNRAYNMIIFLRSQGLIDKTKLAAFLDGGK